MGNSGWGVTPYFRPENVILHARFQTYLLAEVSLLHGFYRLRSRSRRLSVSYSWTRSWFVPGEAQKVNQLHDQQGTANDFVYGNSHARQKPQSYPLKSTSVFRPGVGLERQQKDFLKSISNSHYYSLFLIHLKLKGQIRSYTLVAIPRKRGTQGLFSHKISVRRGKCCLEFSIT